MQGPPKPEGQGKEARSMCFFKKTRLLKLFFKSFSYRKPELELALKKIKKNTLPPPELA